MYNIRALFLTAALGAAGAILVYPSVAFADKQQQYEEACQSGHRGACIELLAWSRNLCDRGNDDACDYAGEVRKVMQAQTWRGLEEYSNEDGATNRSNGRSRSGRAESICDIYPTRCQPYNAPQRVGPLGLEGYPGTSPIYTPRQLVPSMGPITRGALDAIPPHMRRQLYPDSVRNAVRSGNVDRAIEGSMRRSVDPYLTDINGYGRGGAGYTNDAARGIFNGTVDPATAACQAMGRCR